METIEKKPLAGDAPELYSACRQVEDVDVGASSISGWSLQYDQLSAGQFAGETHEVRFRSLQLFRERMNRIVQQTGSFPDTSTVVGMPLNATGDAFFAGMRVKPGMLLLAPSRSVIDFRSSETMDLLSVSVASSKLSDMFSHDGGDFSNVAVRPSLRVCETGDSVDAVRSALLEMCWLATHYPDRLKFPAVQRDLEDTLLIALGDLLRESGERVPRVTLENRRQLVRKACSYALDHLDDSASILDLCKRVGASRRKLNYCFQDVLGISPIQYLRALRLNGARRDLKNPGHLTSSVQDVAGKWGFWHYGHFGTYYKEMFGECPSDTLRDALARS